MSVAEDIRSAVIEMEDTIQDVEAWGDVLIAIGTAHAEITGEGLRVIGWVIKRLGDDLDIELRNALHAAGGRP